MAPKCKKQVPPELPPVSLAARGPRFKFCPVFRELHCREIAEWMRLAFAYSPVLRSRCCLDGALLATAFALGGLPGRFLALF